MPISHHPHKIIKLLAALGVAAGCFLGAPTTGHAGDLPAGEPPNIILISIEATRADHLGCYGYGRATSPAIDRLAREGVRFENMFVQRGLTWPSLTSIMTSRYPVNHGVRDNGHFDTLADQQHLAEIMKSRGYMTGAFLGNACQAEWPGFDRRFCSEDWNLTREAVRWIEENRTKKMFLWIHYLSPHKPYQPPPPYDAFFDPGYSGAINGSTWVLDRVTLGRTQLSPEDLNHVISLYDGSILFVDSQIQLILSKLESLGIRDKSLIIITADHGEDMYDHNFYFYHAASIHDSSLKVPLIMAYPGMIPAGQTAPGIVRGVDLAPTILELAGMKIPSFFEGRSLSPLVFSKAAADDFDDAVSEWEDKILSIRDHRYRYIYNPQNHHPHMIVRDPSWGYDVAEEELYDIIADPKETNNLALTHPKLLRRMKKKLMDWEFFKKWRATHNIEEQDARVPQETLEQLRALGYAQ